jgi:predicted nucleotidyltransferase
LFGFSEPLHGGQKSALATRRLGRESWNIWEVSLNRLDAIDLLASSKPILAERYGVTHLALFGSTARDSDEAGSDVDVLVSFNGPASSTRYFGVLFYLEDIFGCPVDLVTDKGLRPELRPFVEREAIHV